VLIGKLPLKIQPTFGVENIENQPGSKIERIYTLGVNFFPEKRVKLAINLSREIFKNLYGGKILGRGVSSATGLLKSHRRMR
jgi:hypothetical protein